MMGFFVAGSLGLGILAALVTILIGAIPNTIALWFVARTELGENAEKVTILNCFICVILLGVAMILWVVFMFLIVIFDIPMKIWIFWISVAGLFATWKAIVEGMFEILEGAYTILVIYFVVSFMVKWYVQPAIFEMFGWAEKSGYEEQWDDEDWDDVELTDAEIEELEKLGEIAESEAPTPAPAFDRNTIMAQAVSNVINEKVATAQAELGINRTITDPAATLAGHNRIAYSVSFTQDGNAVSTGEDSTLRHWLLNPPQGGQPRAGTMARFEEGGGSRTLDVTPDGKWAITGDVQGRVLIWDVSAMKRIKSMPAADQHAGEVLSVAIHPRGRWAISGGLDKKALFWNLEENKVVPFTQQTDMVTAVDLMPDGYLALTGSLDGTVRLIDFHNPNAIVVSGLGRVTTVEAAPDRRHALVGNTRGILYWVDLGHGRIVTEWTGHAEKDVVSVSIDPTGQFAASAGADFNARIWRLAKIQANAAVPTTPPLVLTMPHPGIVRDVDFHPDSTAVLTGCDDGRVRLWNLYPGQ